MISKLNATIPQNVLSEIGKPLELWFKIINLLRRLKRTLESDGQRRARNNTQNSWRDFGIRRGRGSRQIKRTISNALYNWHNKKKHEERSNWKFVFYWILKLKYHFNYTFFNYWQMFIFY